MPKPFKFRYVNEITGGFVLLVLLLLIVGVILAGNAQRWFEPVHKMVLMFPPEGSLDLQQGAEVRILGAQVGTLQRISVADDGNMSGKISIRDEFIRFVRSDSKAIVKKKFGVAGDAYVEITKGTGAQLEDGASLVCVPDKQIIEMVQEIVKQVQEAVLPMIDKIQKAVEEYTGVASDLRNPEGNLQQLLGHLNQIAAGLEKGEGTAGKLMRDPSLANELGEITVKINESLAEVRQILHDVELSTAKLPTMAGVIEGEVKDLPGMVLQTQDTLRETTRLIEGLQKHWLIRAYINKGEPGTRIPPSAAGGTP